MIWAINSEPLSERINAGVPFVAFVLWPLIHGVALGFFDVQLSETRFIGLDNYRRLLDGLIVDEIELIARVRTELGGNI